MERRTATDDPLLWITKAGYNSVQDYSMSRLWENVDIIGDALEPILWLW